MNFLAHCLLAAQSQPPDSAAIPDLIAGGLLGDLVKGAIPSDWPPSLQAGLRLHRRIDAFSNATPGIRASCRRFPAELRRLAPVFVDIIADHCLAADWPARHDEPLDAFSARCRVAVEPHAHRLNPSARRLLDGLLEEDLLAAYRAYPIMERGLLSVTRRLGQEQLNEALLAFVATALPDLQADFDGYFPSLLAQGREWTAGNVAGDAARP